MTARSSFETTPLPFVAADNRVDEDAAGHLGEVSELDPGKSGALTLTLGETGRLDRLSGGLCKSGDLDSACDYMVRFAAAGFRAVCGPKSNA